MPATTSGGNASASTFRPTAKAVVGSTAAWMTSFILSLSVHCVSSPKVSKRKMSLPCARKATSVTVEKVQVKSLARGVPAESLTPVVILAVQVTLAGIGSATSDCARLVGFSVMRTKLAVLLAASYVTEPKMAASAGHTTLKLADLSVAGSMARSKVTLTMAVFNTPVAASTGVVETTLGAGAGVGGGVDVEPLLWSEPPQPARLTPSAMDTANGNHCLCKTVRIAFPSSLDVANQNGTPCRAAARGRTSPCRPASTACNDLDCMPNRAVPKRDARIGPCRMGDQRPFTS